MLEPSVVWVREVDTCRILYYRQHSGDLHVLHTKLCLELVPLQGIMLQAYTASPQRMPNTFLWEIVVWHASRRVQYLYCLGKFLFTGLTIIMFRSMPYKIDSNSTYQAAALSSVSAFIGAAHVVVVSLHLFAGHRPGGCHLCVPARDARVREIVTVAIANPVGLREVSLLLAYLRWLHDWHVCSLSGCSVHYSLA